MSYKKSDEDVKRLAEVIFTNRMTKAPLPGESTKTEAIIDKMVDGEAYLSLCAAEAFCDCVEGWLTKEKG